MEKLSQQNFTIIIKSFLILELGNDYNVTSYSDVKNNMITENLLSISCTQQNVSLVINLDSYYASYLNGCTLESMAHMIFNKYIKYKENILSSKIDYMDYHSVREHIFLKLINYGMNKNILHEVPNQRICDLTAVAYIQTDIKNHSLPNIMIKDSFLEQWSISRDDVFEQARINCQNLLPARIIALPALLSELNAINSGLQSSGQYIGREHSYNQNIYVLTNFHSTNGAVCILYDGLLKKFAMEHDTDIIILPSSIHEAILLPYHDILDAASLFSMVQEINRDVLKMEDILSDNVYIYKLDMDTIKIME